jgi:hypothetical protein
MDDETPNAWLGRASVLRAWIAKIRVDGQGTKRQSGERRRVLDAVRGFVRRKRDERISTRDSENR